MARKLAFVGAGAVGSYVGGHLARHGEDVTLIDPWPEHIAAIRRDGLSLEGTQGEFVARPSALHLHEVQGLRQPVDVAFICVKSYDTAWAAELIRPYLAPGAMVVSLQNGINEERIARIVGWGRVVGCIASGISVNAHAPGRVKRTIQPGGEAHTVFRAGELHGRITPRLEDLVRKLSLIDSARATTDLWGERWTKLVLNAMGNGLSAITGLGGRDLTLNDEVRRMSIQLGGEAVAVGQALGFQVGAIRGAAPEVLMAAARGDAAALQVVEAGMLGRLERLTGEVRASAGQDIDKGRRTEIDDLNGLVADKGEEAGIAAPTHRALVEVVKQVERGEVRPGVELVQRVRELVAAAGTG